MLGMSWNQDGAGRTDATGIECIDGLYGYAMALTRNHAQAEDLVQETYVRAIPAMGRVQTHSNMKGWLFTILRNIWLNELRKWRNGPQLVEIDLADGVADSVVEPSRNSHDLYVSKIEAEQVRAAIQELSVDFREIILLREYEELTYQEIASILNNALSEPLCRGWEGLAQSFVSCSRQRLRGPTRWSEMPVRHAFPMTLS
jgi:RNA polymerase sigma-70 factor (ECF subfamily)